MITIDPGRLRRSVFLDVERFGLRYLVTGGREPHEVEDGRCDCPDHVWRGHECKHILAVRLHKGDREVIEALRTVVLAESCAA